MRAAETLFTLQQKSEDVISYGVDHQQKQYEHAYHLSPFLKFEAEFPAENHLDEQKHGVASVKGRNRQDVHKRKYDADERCQFPKTLPVPCCGEHAADSSERSHALCSLFCKQVFEVADIALEYVYTVLAPCGERLEKRLVYGGGLVVIEGGGLYYSHA